MTSIYKEQIREMKHSLERNSVNVVPKRQHVKEMERNITPKDLEMINFVECMHGMIRFVEKR
jgi:hypothetical protein